jgi:hypothetical protein
MLLTACGGDRDGGPSGPPSRSAGSPTDAEPAPSESAAVDGLAPDLLLPNMRSLAASDLRVVREDGERRLRFAGSLANLGPGPMVVRPRARGGCPPRRIAALQLVHRDTSRDGAFQRRRDPVGQRRDAGCMLNHPTHDHWHFDAMAAYSLRRQAGTVLVARDKVSFCLRDNRRAPGADRRVPRAHFGECGRRTDQGISPGWIDVYDADLDGQYLILPPSPLRRTLCLVVTADPHNQLVETDETDNASVLPVRIRGLEVRRVKSGCGEAA